MTECQRLPSFIQQQELPRLPQKARGCCRGLIRAVNGLHCAMHESGSLTQVKLANAGQAEGPPSVMHPPLRLLEPQTSAGGVLKDGWKENMAGIIHNMKS